MKTLKNKIYPLLLMAILPFGCGEEFLNRPPKDTYIAQDWFQNEDQIQMANNALYGGVWFDFQRSFLAIGDVMAGNSHQGADNVFYTFNVNASTQGLADAYNSLWMAVGYSNSVIEGITKYAPPTLSNQVVNTGIGEALVWKSMAYFYLVRAFGPVPIIESHSDLVTAGTSNTLYRNTTEDVYEYIVRLLMRAAELLPVQNDAGRINRYSAYGLLAKVYLTRSGVGQDGSRKQSDLDKAAEYAKLVMEGPYALESEYWNLFRIRGNRNAENLISWHWVGADAWGSQNALQADLAVQNLTGFGDGWGTWSGPSINLQQLFGEDATKIGEENRVMGDKRRRATMMMDGDFYTDLQRDKASDPNNDLSPKGLKVIWNAGPQFQSPTGAWARKHIVGNAKDNEAEGGGFIDFMKTSLSTHLLRLADIYLIYAEAKIGNNANTSDQSALDAINAVVGRATGVDSTFKEEIDMSIIMDERRRELAYEGDNWYDFVRLHYYKPDEAIDLLAEQERGTYDGNATKLPITLKSQHYTPTDGDFQLPIPEADYLKNPNLMKDPVPFDFGTMKPVGR